MYVEVYCETLLLYYIIEFVLSGKMKTFSIRDGLSGQTQLWNIYGKQYKHNSGFLSLLKGYELALGLHLVATFSDTILIKAKYH